MDLGKYLEGLDLMKTRLDELEAENAKLEAALDKTEKNRASILREKRDLEGRSPERGYLEQKLDEMSMPSGLTRNGEMTITRDDARTPAKYREARERAEKAGCPLRIVGDNARPQTERRSSPVKLVVDEMGGVMHANIAVVEKHGQQRMRQLAAEKGCRLAVFRSVEDLPHDAAAKHAEIIASQDRNNLLGDDQ